MNYANLQRTAEAWSQPWQRDLGLHWTDLEVGRRLNAKVSDDEAEDWLAYILRRYFSGQLPLARCYSLGCGYGESESRLAKCIRPPRGLRPVQRRYRRSSSYSCSQGFHQQRVRRPQSLPVGCGRAG